MFVDTGEILLITSDGRVLLIKGNTSKPAYYDEILKKFVWIEEVK